MKYAIGVDLGGTKIEAALIDEEGNKLGVARIPTEVDKGWEQMAMNIEAAVEKVKTREIEGIGIATPGFIHNNQAASNPNVPGIEKAFAKFLEKHPNTIIENDANCFALAEFTWGAGKNTQNMVGIIWGTGIGSGIIDGGNLIRGCIGGAGEVGHTIIDCNLDKYEPGNQYTWEGLASGKHIVRRYLESDGNPVNNHVADIWASDDEVAERTRKETLRFMGIGLGNIVTTFNPELIVIGGGVSNLEVYNELNDEMRKYTNHLAGNACTIVKNKLGDSAGVLGAAALVFRK